MYKILSLLLIGILIIGCSKNNPQAPELTGMEDPSFLLVAGEDPLGIEQESAFMIDGIGPLYFGVLDLSDEQIDQIREIVSQYRDDFKNLQSRWRQGKSWSEIREQRRALREEISAAIEEILTEEQKAILEEIKTQLENGEFPDIIIDKRVEFLTAELNLTSEQQEQIKALFKEYGNRLLAARNNGKNPRQFRIMMTGIFKELDEAISALLTEEQLQLYNQLKAKYFYRGRHRGGYDYRNWPGRP